MDWQVTFLEHIRKAHFTLLAVSLALCVAGTLSPDAPIEKAYLQARAALSIKEDVFRPSHSKSVSERLGVLFMVDKKYYEALGASHTLSGEILDGIKEYFSSLPKEEIGHSWEWSFLASTKGNLNRHSFSSEHSFMRPHTLKSYISAWDFYWNGKALEVTGIDWDGLRIYQSGSLLEKVNVKKRPLAFFDTKSGLRVEKDQKQNFVRPQWYVVVEFKNKDNELAFDEIHIPIIARKRFDIDMQKEMFGASADKEYRGAFKEAFGDLAYYARGLETLEIEPLAEYLRQRFQQDDKKIVIFGIDIPRSIIGQWGVILLAVIQLYYFLHLYRLRILRLDSAVFENFPWIMVYPGALPRIVSISTISVIPVFSSIILVYGVWGIEASTLNKLGLAAGALINILLAVVTLWYQLKPQAINSETLAKDA